MTYSQIDRPPIVPPRLRPGDTLGIIATSSPIAGIPDSAVERGYSRLESMGLRVVEAPNCRVTVGHTAGTIEDRVDAIHAFLEDPKIDGIMAFWGGFQTHQLLEYLDFDRFAENPKPIIGYSDLTALLNVVTARTGLTTYLGPAAITFAKPTVFDYTVSSLRDVVFGTPENYTYRPSETISTNVWYKNAAKTMIERPNPGWRCHTQGLARGRLMGGNLGTLLLLAGTPFWPDLRDAILVVEEDEDETPEMIDRYFTQLRHLGTFEEIGGLVVGRFPDSVQFNDEDRFESILDRALEGFDIPTLYEVDVGHTDPLMTVPLGTDTLLDAGERILTLNPEAEDHVDRKPEKIE